ncbi:MAG: acetate--CoA ligase family protein [Syntrophobacteraceae bacterium]
MDDLFNAESIVIIGVSDAIDNLGKNVVSNLVNLGYKGKIYPVGPRGGEVSGLPIYRSVSELPGTAEVAVVLVPASFVSDVLAQCCDKGTGWAVISSAGFREHGEKGAMLEEEIMKTTKRCGIRIIGPNCVGFANTANALYAPFTNVTAPFRTGKTAIFSQSGGIGNSLCGRLSSSGVGIGKFVSMGNKLDLDEVDYLAYLVDDPETSLIYFYLEDFKRGRLFADLARGCSKPIILHKSNTSAVSSTIAQSHTAALAVDDQVVDSVCRETGILRVNSVIEGINVAKGLSLQPLKGKNLAIMSRSAGHAVAAADACAAFGFHLPPLKREILDDAREMSRADIIRLGNPLDLGDIYMIDSHVSILERILSQPDIDGVVHIHVSQMVMEIELSRALVKKVSALSSQFGKPVALVLEIPFDERVYQHKNSDFPFFQDCAEAVRALAVNLKWQKTVAARRSKHESAMMCSSSSIPADDIRKWFGDIARQKRQPLLHEVLDLLDLAGVPTVPWRMAESLDKLIDASRELDFPLALKAVSPSLLHKSDRGAISLNVPDAESLRDEWYRLQKISGDISGIVAQKMASASRELVVGGKRDPSFGPVVLTGLGGIMVEVMRDVSMRLAPVNADTALEMFEELSGKRILGSFRGMREADLHAAADILVKVSLLMHHFPQIREMDLNPVSLNDGGKGVLALDARVLIEVA